jgi:zinc transporter 1
MLFLTASFFLVEIIVGYVTNSIALVADSFHMLSDVVALIVGFASIRVSAPFMTFVVRALNS